MIKYPLEWGWDQPDTSSADTGSSDWKPTGTLLGRKDDNVEPVAYGDLKCQSCGAGRASGMTGAYDVDGTIMCRNCAVKAKKIGHLPGGQQNEILRPLELQGK
jgi:hypothetical protein